MSATRTMTPAEAMAAAGDESGEMDPYRIVDGKGGWLEVRRVTFISGGLPVVATGGQGFAVDPLEIPEITRAMYEAAGHKPPAMLGRPETCANGTPTAIGRVYPYRSAKGPLVGFGGEFPGGASVLIKPHEARQAAAVLVAYADAAEPEPDPAEVEELTGVLLAADPEETCTRASLEALARAALLAGWKREAGHD